MKGEKVSVEFLSFFLIDFFGVGAEKVFLSLKAGSAR